MPTDRFLANILGGRLYPSGVPDWGPWEASRLHWWSEDHVDPCYSDNRERKVRTTEELEDAIKEPMTVAPTQNVWIHKSLEDDAAIRTCRLFSATCVWQDLAKTGM